MLSVPRKRGKEDAYQNLGFFEPSPGFIPGASLGPLIHYITCFDYFLLSLEN